MKSDGNPFVALGIAIGSSSDADQSRASALQEISASMRPVIQGLPTHTTITYPIIAAGKLRGAVRFDLDFETEAAQQGCRKFIGDASESLERFYLLHDRREAVERLATVDDERRLSDAAHADLRLDATAFALANEGRLVVGCDRLSVLIRRGARYRLTAVSGQDSINRRTSAAHALESVTRSCVATGDTITFPGATELAEDLTLALEDYVDESHAKRLVVAPLVRPPTAPDDDPSGVGPARPLGALVFEYFGETMIRRNESRLIDIVARTGAAALDNALKYDGLFLGRLWQRLGSWRSEALEPGTRRRTLFVLAAIAAGVVALATIPKEFTAYCRGTLNPVERRRVFAPLDGTVQRVAVKHGDRVSRGQLLIELRNTDLDIASADVAGRRTASAEQLIAVERTLFDEGRRITAEERARLSGERSQIREQLISLDRQIALYVEKRKQLSIVSPIDGEVTTWNTEDLLENRPVRLGQQLLTIAAVGGPWELELRVPDDRSGRVVEAARRSGEPLLVTYSPAVDPGLVRTGRVVEIENSAELRATTAIRS